MPRALLSVYDKRGLVALARRLSTLSWELVASGGTARMLADAELAVTPVAALTGQAELFDGRVKTLHPAIHAGILARDSAADQAQLAQAGFAPIDMVVCNLYPFREVSARAGSTLEEVIEQIDIGGVTLLRAAAKNFARVIALSDPDDYDRVVQQLERAGAVDTSTRRALAAKVFALTRDCDTAIHAHLLQETLSAPESVLPARLTQTLHRAETLRYGENPHQAAAWYCLTPGAGPLGGELLGGQKPLSYNNYLDLDAAWRAVSSFPRPTVAVIKHLSPIGLASAEQLADACVDALATDPLSAFGSVLAANRVVDADFARALERVFVECIVAPDFDPDARELLATRRRNCRLLRMPQNAARGSLEQRSVAGGLLVQQVDRGDPPTAQWRTVTAREPDSDERAALEFAWRAVQHVPSNAIVVARGGAVLGVGGGLPSRVDAVALALRKAGSRARGAALASDAFFPFADGIEAAIAAGVRAVIQPGGSVRDEEVIAAADAGDVAMVFSGARHFRH